MTYSEGTASVSCVDSTSSVSGHQVILLQQNYANRVVVVNVSSVDLTNVHVIPGGRYCIMELQEEDNEVKYSSEFIAEETTAFTMTSYSERSSIGCKMIRFVF